MARDKLLEQVLPVYSTMIVKHIQIYGVHISRKCVCKTEKKLKVDLFTTRRQNSLPGLYHHPLGRVCSFLAAKGVDYEPISKCIALSQL